MASKLLAANSCNQARFEILFSGMNSILSRLVVLFSFLWVCSFGSAQVSVLTYLNDNSRSGQNINETVLTPSNVTGQYFGKLFSYDVDGFIVGQTLYVPHVTIPDHGAHNVIYAATQHDSMYAFDADSPGTGTPLWTVSFINPAQGVTTIPINVQGCGGATSFTEIGIMGTPVIDPVAGTIFVVVKTVENKQFYFRLHALDYTTGVERPGSPVVISGTFAGATFSSKNEIQRPALLLNNGIIYVAFGSNGCDVGSQGWVMAYDSTTLAQLGALSAEPQQSWGANIWSSGSGPASDADGNIYLSTANGVFDANVGGLDYSDSVLRLSMGSNGPFIADYFTPYDQQLLGTNDTDLGSGGVLLLPDQHGRYKHLLVTAGKEGTIYLLDRDGMGGYNPVDNSQIVQNLPGAIGHLFGGPLYFNNAIYFAAKGDSIKAFSVIDGLLSSAPIAQSSKVAELGVPTISANATSNSILWLILGTSQRGHGQLAAFDASTLVELYSSGQQPERDTVGSVAHFAPTTVADGRVYVGTQSQLAVYGLLPKIMVLSGDNQGGVVGTTLKEPLKVQLLDSYSGLPLAGVTINFDDGNKGGVFGNPTPATDENGIATTSYTLPPIPGRYRISATNINDVPAFFLESGATLTALP